jgi:hypothetical protein
MKLHYKLLLLSLGFYAAGFSQTADCSRYKNGSFKLIDPRTKKVCLITRDGNTQTEKMEDAEEVYDFDIKWLDDCTYTVSPTPATIARNKDVRKVGTMTVKITQVKDSSYVHKVTVANNPKLKRVDEVFVVEEKHD